MADKPSKVAQRDWETWYQDEDVESMPWYLAQLDHDFEQTLSDLSPDTGLAVLDLGSGPGTQAIELANRGFVVTGTDISVTAVKKAAERARREGQAVQFLQDDILNTRLNGKRFAIIFDRGCFHTLPIEMRPVYVRNVTGLLGPGGFLLLKCFSHLQPGTEGPHRLWPEEIREYFERDFVIHAMRDSVFLGNHKPEPRALYSVLQKK